ncbi:MAG: hypothetical protein HY535_01400 [Chloroflexi bacterium]|nr:hypothetical protein [Chloroflexota bacterium]
MKLFQWRKQGKQRKAQATPEPEATQDAVPAPPPPTSRQLFGRDFRIVGGGLAEEDVLKFVDTVTAEYRARLQEHEEVQTWGHLFKQVLAEAEREGVRIKNVARRESEEQAARVLGEAKKSAREVMEEATARAKALAEQKAQEILTTAQAKAQVTENRARQLSELTLIRAHEWVQEYLSSEVHGAHERLIAALEGMVSKAREMGEDWKAKTLELWSGPPFDASKELPRVLESLPIGELSVGTPMPGVGREEPSPATEVGVRLAPGPMEAEERPTGAPGLEKAAGDIATGGLAASPQAPAPLTRPTAGTPITPEETPLTGIGPAARRVEPSPVVEETFEGVAGGTPPPGRTPSAGTPPSPGARATTAPATTRQVRPAPARPGDQPVEPGEEVLGPVAAGEARQQRAPSATAARPAGTAPPAVGAPEGPETRAAARLAGSKQRLEPVSGTGVRTAPAPVAAPDTEAAPGTSPEGKAAGVSLLDLDEQAASTAAPGRAKAPEQKAAPPAPAAEEAQARPAAASDKKGRQEAEQAAAEVLYSGEVELVLTPPVNFAQVSQLYNFLQNMRELKVLHTAGSWEQGTVVTVLLESPVPLVKLLGGQPGVVVNPNLPAAGTGVLRTTIGALGERSRRRQRIGLSFMGDSETAEPKPKQS